MVYSQSHPPPYTNTGTHNLRTYIPTHRNTRVTHTVASRNLNLGPDQPEGWSGMADTTVTHPAGDGEHLPNPNQRDERHLAGQPGRRFKRLSGADGKADK